MTSSTRTTTSASTRRRAATSASGRVGSKTRRTRGEIAKAKLASERRWALHILRTYGITADEYWCIYEAQGRRCYVCQRATGATRRLAVDHCHATGRVRGLCCKYCNRLLGFARDDVTYFQRAIEYLTHPPAFDVIGERVVPA